MSLSPSIINTANMAILVVLIPIWGAISDRVGIQKVPVTTVIVAIVKITPLFWLIGHKEPVYVFLSQFGMVMLLARISPALRHAWRSSSRHRYA